MILLKKQNPYWERILFLIEREQICLPYLAIRLGYKKVEVLRRIWRKGEMDPDVSSRITFIFPDYTTRWFWFGEDVPAEPRPRDYANLPRHICQMIVMQDKLEYDPASSLPQPLPPDDECEWFDPETDPMEYPRAFGFDLSGEITGRWTLVKTFNRIWEDGRDWISETPVEPGEINWKFGPDGQLSMYEQYTKQATVPYAYDRNTGRLFIRGRLVLVTRLNREQLIVVDWTHAMFCPVGKLIFRRARTR